MNLTFKYLAVAPLAGRGGLQRFFMLAHDISFQEQLYGSTERTQGMQRLLEKNPTGGLPVTYLEDASGKTRILSQHIATCRYLSKIHNVEHTDAFRHFVQDLVADEYQGFMNAFVDASYINEEEKKESYRTVTVPDNLKKFEAFYRAYKKQDGPFLSNNGKPLWGESAVFTILHDNIVSGLLALNSNKYPHLTALYRAHAAIPAIATWMEANERRSA